MNVFIHWISISEMDIRISSKRNINIVMKDID